MEGSMTTLRRVLIANRGEIGRRLNITLHELGYETVACFTSVDSEEAWLEDADYQVYLTGEGEANTWRDPLRVLSAAMDAGCEAIHPGYCFLAEHVDFFAMSTNANMAVIGCDPQVIQKAVSRHYLRQIGRALGLPLLPASDPLDPDDDGLAAGAQLGLPLFVKAVNGGVRVRVDALEALPAAVATARARSAERTGNASVYLERFVPGLREIGTVVVADRHGTHVHLGESDGSAGDRFCTWVEEIGPSVLPALHAKLGAAAVQISRQLGWVGVGKVRWVVAPDGGWYLRGFSARLPTGYSLFEAVHGVDLVRTQIRALLGEPLGWEQADAHPSQHGLQVRLLHVDPQTGGRPGGVLERLDVPSGVTWERGLDDGATCSVDSEPLLAKITIVADNRADAVRQARAVLEGVVVEGVVTNRDAILAILSEPTFVRGSGRPLLIASVDDDGPAA